MRGPVQPRVLVALATGLAASCVVGDGTSGPGRSLVATLAIQPVLGPQAANGAPLEINRIRLRVAQDPGNTTLLETFVDVDPSASSWSVPLEIPLGIL